MAAEHLYADGVIFGTSTSLSGDSNAFGAPDGVYTTNTGGDSWEARFSLASPSGNIASNAFFDVRAWIRKDPAADPQSAAPTITLEVWEHGSAITVVEGPTNVGTQTFVSGLLDSNLLSDPTGAGIEVRVIVSGAGGSPKNRSTVQLDSVDVFVELAAPAAPNGGATGGWSADGTASGSTPKAGTASGSWQATGSAAGSTVHSGDAAGAWQADGSAAGSTAHSGSAAGSWSAEGVADGHTPLVVQDGSATGSWSADGEAAGSATHSGSAAGSWTAAGEGAGAAARSGGATGTWSADGTASGSAVHSGAAETVWSADGEAEGHADHSGSAEGTWSIGGEAVSVMSGPVRDLRLLSTEPPTLAATTTGPATEPVTTTEPVAAWTAGGPGGTLTIDAPTREDWPTGEPATIGPSVAAPDLVAVTTEPNL